MLKKDETIEVKYRVKDTHHHRIGVRSKQHAQPSSTAAASLPSAMKVTTNPTVSKNKKNTKTVQIAVNDVPYILPTKVKQDLPSRQRIVNKPFIDELVPWELSVTPPDRDELLTNLDANIARFRNNKPKYGIPKPVAPSVLPDRASSSNVVSNRNRPVVSSGPVIGYNYKNIEDNGIHDKKWAHPPTIEDDPAIEWLKPQPKGSERSHEEFQNNYIIPLFKDPNKIQRNKNMRNYVKKERSGVLSAATLPPPAGDVANSVVEVEA